MALDQRVDPTGAGVEARFHPPGDAVVNETSALSAQASVSVAAGVNGQKRVVTGFSFRLASAIQLASGTVGCHVIDGATATTSYLWSEVIAITTTGADCRMSGLNLIGSADTALTIEFDRLVTGAHQSVNMAYHTLSGYGA